jgi:hypothetical protein
MTIADLFHLLERLRAAKISYRLAQHRESAIAIEVAVPGERWEIEVMEDSTIQVERFRSDGTISGEEAIQQLIAEYSD